MALEWTDIDWRVPAMSVRGTKTEASADTVPITQLAHGELRAWWETCGQPAAGLIFPNEEGKGYASATGYKKALETAAGRRSDGTCTCCATRSRRSPGKMLDRVYCRPRPADLVAAVAAFDLV